MITGGKINVKFREGSKTYITVGRVLNAWFNDCVLCWSSRIANLIIAVADPVPNCRIRGEFMFANLINANLGKTRNSQLIESRN